MTSGKVVEFGSETVDELMTLERYSHVMHLTSQVSGRLRPGLGPWTSEGDPARRYRLGGAQGGAMQIIDELEPARRGPYAGVVGYIDFSGNVDTAIAIRTMLVGADGHASVEAGAGIVADSIAEDEDLECRNKAAALLAAVAGPAGSPGADRCCRPGAAGLTLRCRRCRCWPGTQVPGPGGRSWAPTRGEMGPAAPMTGDGGYLALRGGQGARPLPRDVVRVAGDAESYLQGRDEPGHCQLGPGSRLGRSSCSPRANWTAFVRLDQRN